MSRSFAASSVFLVILSANIAVAQVQPGLMGSDVRILVEFDPHHESLAGVNIFDLGVDDEFGIDPTTGNPLFRVSESILDEFDELGLPYTIITNDIYSAYAEYRANLRKPADESFVDYHDWNAAVQVIEGLAAQHPDLVALEQIGESLEGRPILALRISNDAQNIHPERPAMLLTGCHHAREWISVEVPLYIADRLVDDYGNDGDVTRLLNYAEIWIIPVVNPDGFVYTYTNDRFWRKNRRDNGDGTFGVDPNRNYSFQWGGDAGSSSFGFSQTYRGPAPFSEPETRAVRDLLTGSLGRTFASGLSYHNYSQFVMYPNGFTTAPIENVSDYADIAGTMATLINDAHADPQYDYIAGQSSKLLYVTTGDFNDYMHYVVGGFGITIELRPGFVSFELPPNEILPTCQENWPAAMHMAEQTLIPGLRETDDDLDGFVGFDDYCANSPAGMPVDNLGCAESQQDYDGDDVPNLADACLDSLPGQLVGKDGCRVEPAYTVSISASVPGISFDLAPADIDNYGPGTTSTNGIQRHYATATDLIVSAPATSGVRLFRHWEIDGAAQPAGKTVMTVPASTDVDLHAVYAAPTAARLVGPTRIPDKLAGSISFEVTFTAEFLYDDGTTFPTEIVTLMLNTPSAGLLVESGTFLAYDVSAETGERVASFTATVQLGDGAIETNPFTLVIFDAATLTPNCSSVSISGPAAANENSELDFRADVAFQPGMRPAVSDDDILWEIYHATDKSSAVPASFAPRGKLSVDRVDDNMDLVVRALYANPDGTVCSADAPLKVIAVDDPNDVSQPVPASGNMCGAMGLLSLIAMVTGLFICRSAER